MTRQLIIRSRPATNASPHATLLAAAVVAVLAAPVAAQLQFGGWLGNRSVDGVMAGCDCG